MQTNSSAPGGLLVVQDRGRHPEADLVRGAGLFPAGPRNSSFTSAPEAISWS